jgi:hypothetical protein
VVELLTEWGSLPFELPFALPLDALRGEDFATSGAVTAVDLASLGLWATPSGDVPFLAAVFGMRSFLSAGDFVLLPGLLLAGWLALPAGFCLTVVLVFRLACVFGPSFDFLSAAVVLEAAWPGARLADLLGDLVLR